MQHKTEMEIIEMNFLNTHSHVSAVFLSSLKMNETVIVGCIFNGNLVHFGIPFIIKVSKSLTLAWSPGVLYRY